MKIHILLKNFINNFHEIRRAKSHSVSVQHADWLFNNQLWRWLKCNNRFANPTASSDNYLKTILSFLLSRSINHKAIFKYNETKAFVYYLFIKIYKYIFTNSKSVPVEIVPVEIPDVKIDFVSVIQILLSIREKASLGRLFWKYSILIHMIRWYSYWQAFRRSEFIVWCLKFDPATLISLWVIEKSRVSL